MRAVFSLFNGKGPIRSLSLSLSLALIASACARGEGTYRGAGLPVDSIPTSELVDIYRATLGGAFTLTDPTLSVLVDPIYLPRSSGLVGGDTMPPVLVSALQSSGVVRGVCQVPITATRVPLICRNAERAGYVARFSPPFAMPGDTVQVHLVVQQYAIPSGPVEQRLRFERAYYVVRSGTTWSAVREARLSAP